MAISKIPEFNTPESLYGNELEFLKINSKQISESLMDHLKTNPDFINKLEIEIGSYFSRNPSISEAEKVYDQYINLVWKLNLKAKTVIDLKTKAKLKSDFVVYLNDEKVDININEIFFENGKNKLGERLGEGKAIQTLKIWHDGRLTKEQIVDIQKKLNIPLTGKIDKITLIKIIEFQTYNCELVDGKIVLNGETYNRIYGKETAKPKITLEPIVIRKKSIEENTFTKKESNVDEDIAVQSSEKESLTKSEQSNKNTTQINNFKLKYESLIKEFGTIERKSGFEYIGEQASLDLLNKEAQRMYGQKLIISTQIALGLPLTGNINKEMIFAIINYQFRYGEKDVKLLPSVDSLFFQNLEKETTFPKNPGRIATLFNHKNLSEKIPKITDSKIEDLQFQKLVDKNNGIENIIKRNTKNLILGNKNGIRELQVLLGLPGNGIVDEKMIKSIFHAQLECKKVTNKGLVDLKVTSSSYLLDYLKFKIGTNLKKHLLDYFALDDNQNKFVKSINSRIESNDFKIEHIMNFIDNIPNNVLSNMIIYFGIEKIKDFYLSNQSGFNPSIPDLIQEYVVLFLSETSKIGLLDENIQGKGKKFNKVTKVSLCSRTAWENLVETFGVSHKEVIRGDAQKVKDSLDKQNLMKTFFGFAQAQENILGMAKEMKGNVFDVFFDKHFDANGDKRKPRGGEKHGHRCVVFVGADGKLRTLDPYIPQKNGKRSNKPFLFAEHIFAKRYGIGVSQRAYYSDNLALYNFDNKKTA